MPFPSAEDGQRWGVCPGGGGGGCLVTVLVWAAAYTRHSIAVGMGVVVVGGGGALILLSSTRPHIAAIFIYVPIPMIYTHIGRYMDRQVQSKTVGRVRGRYTRKLFMKASTIHALVF